MLTMLRYDLGCICECEDSCCSDQNCTDNECRCKQLEKTVEFEFLMDLEKPTLH